ncbi:MAG TPA: VWA domain-containing protein [Pyrinomonadaceae bacterium]|jgi:VWFA-related protein
MLKSRSVAVLVLLLWLGMAVGGQERERLAGGRAASEASAAEQGGEEVGDDDVVRIDTNLVTVPVSIKDRDGRFVPHLKREDFRVYEEGLEQEVAYFAAVEKPFSVVLMIDVSVSTWSKLGQIKEAAKAFVEQLRPEDSVMVVSFAKGLKVKCEPTSDRQVIREAIEEVDKGSSTRLYDAMERLMDKYLGRIQGRKAVVLFTDGVDSASDDATYESTVREAEELDAIIYPIRYDTYDPKKDKSGSSGSRISSILRTVGIPVPNISGGGGGGSGYSKAEYVRGERYLHELAELTGGHVYEANKDLSYLQQAFTQIAEELRRQYSLGYYPKQPGQPGERRRIRVQARPPDLSVRTRDSYIYKPALRKAAIPEQTQTPPPVLKNSQSTSP